MFRFPERRPAVCAELSPGALSSTLNLRRTGRRHVPDVWHTTRLEWGLQAAPQDLAEHWPGVPAHRVRRLTLILPDSCLYRIQLEAARHLQGLALERHLVAGLETHLGSSDGLWWFDFRLPDETGRQRETTRQIAVTAVRGAVLAPLLQALADARLPLDAIRPEPQDAPDDRAGAGTPDTDSLLARMNGGTA